MFVRGLLCVLAAVTLSEQITFLEKLKKQSYQLARWCVLSQGEMEKCHVLSEILKTARTGNTRLTGVTQLPVFTCVRGIDVFDCMTMIENDRADLITLDSGVGYFGGRYHNLLPLMAEHYSSDISVPTTFEAVAVVKKNNRGINLSNLKNARSCHPSIGDSAGWVYPIGKLMAERHVNVSVCNAPVASVSKLFSNGMCLPGSINSFFNQFGNNPVSACGTCKGVGDDWCSSGDPYAGYDGAFNCLRDGAGDIAFIRHDTLQIMQDRSHNTSFNIDDYELLCPDNKRRSISDHSVCNWGSPQSQIVMTSGMKDDTTIALYKALLQKLSDWFGERSNNQFRLFRSEKFYKYKKLNLMFNDATKMLVDVGDRDSYYTWVGDSSLRRGTLRVDNTYCT